MLPSHNDMVIVACSIFLPGKGKETAAMQTMLLVNGAPRDLKHYLYNLINKHVFRLLQGW